MRLPWLLGRWLIGAFIAIAFAPGLVIVFGALIIGPDRWFAFFGLWFLGVAAAIAIGVGRAVEEVVVTRKSISWRGYFIGGDGPLSAVRAVRGATWPYVGVTFEIDGHRRFDVMPARGMRDFIDALHTIAPGLPISLPRSALSGAFFFGRAKVTVVIDDAVADSGS